MDFIDCKKSRKTPSLMASDLGVLPRHAGFSSRESAFGRGFWKKKSTGKLDVGAGFSPAQCRQTADLNVLSSHAQKCFRKLSMHAQACLSMLPLFLLLWLVALGGYQLIIKYVRNFFFNIEKPHFFYVFHNLIFIPPRRLRNLVKQDSNLRSIQGRSYVFFWYHPISKILHLEFLINQHHAWRS